MGTRANDITISSTAKINGLNLGARKAKGVDLTFEQIECLNGWMKWNTANNRVGAEKEDLIED
jgi:hypothetical protein